MLMTSVMKMTTKTIRKYKKKMTIKMQTPTSNTTQTQQKQHDEIKTINTSKTQHPSHHNSSRPDQQGSLPRAKSIRKCALGEKDKNSPGDSTPSPRINYNIHNLIIHIYQFWIDSHISVPCLFIGPGVIRPTARSFPCAIWTMHIIPFL